MGNTRSVFAISAFLWLTIGAADAAEFIGLNIGQSQLNPPLWRPLYQSDLESIDLVDDLDVENPEQSSMVLILEHPISALPNFRYEGYELDSSLSSSVNSNNSVNGETHGSAETATSFELSQDDFVLYYQLRNSRMNLDLGVDLKRFDGEISLGDSSSRVSVDETIPLLYLSARVDLPYDGFYVGAHINSNFIDLGLSKSSAQDSAIMLGYESGNGLGVEGGIKYFSLDLDDIDQTDTELEYDSIYLNGYYNF
ncbi:MAG: TIGR04219 family outer membrane beta-barrel protein [Gammaproteobacteria bacterium]|nr:TIGR04219 family outer membrane beta-barrel protein [Gammaproteobacteria bacterium]